MVSFRQLLRSFRYAWQGLRFIWQNEQNFRLQVGVALLVIVGMIFFRITLGEAIILMMLIIFVLVLEVVNTIFEKFIDVLKPRLHTYVGVIKDLMAAAVLLAAIGAAVVATMVFWPYCRELIQLLQ